MKNISELNAAKKFGPGYFIRERMEIEGWVQEDLAEILDISLKHLSSILQNKQAISIEVAEKLGDVFNTSTNFWLNLDNEYRIWLRENTDKFEEHKTAIKAELYKYMPIRDLRKKSWIGEKKDLNSLIKYTNDFWNTNKLNFSKMEEAAAVYQKKSEAYKQNSYFLATWFQKAKKISELIEVQSFNKDKLSSVFDKISIYSNMENGVEKFLQQLNLCGLKFFVLPHLEKTFLDGAAFLNNGEYSVVYTARYNRIDNFWFTIAHEIAHILNHINDDLQHILDNLDEKSNEKLEIQANKIASEKLKHSEIIEILEPYSNYLQEDKIFDASKSLNVHPSIVAGTLAYNQLISNKRYNKFKENVLNLIPEKYQF